MRTLLATATAMFLLAGAAAAQPAGATADTPAKMRSVVRAWSARLNANDNPGASRLFSLPAVVSQAGLAYRLDTVKQLSIWHRALPCGGTISRIIVRGRFATAVLTLRERKGHTCDTPGVEAAARLEIVSAKIRTWVQVAVPPPTGPIA